jgi:hypothetical protein
MAKCPTCGGAMLSERPHTHPPADPTPEAALRELTEASQRLLRELRSGKPSENWLSIASWVEAALWDIEAEVAVEVLTGSPVPAIEGGDLQSDEEADQFFAALAASPVPSEGLARFLGVEQLMVVLRPWLGINDDVELERACRHILAALSADRETP